ncbi:winged helix-turn-helix domain-containing protein [Lelliottia nimipressuralis]|uniref:OmpR/PhoB-type domain-containing protein n=1 Tax=Lelliottia nimipressuralis TaxID=69220 RepID=A0ABY3NYN5_9ENTR|nr:winged helix-turn-helix domain-containing protein [Lelliottia nimipressuralis]RXJ10768.1 hypothetical protein ETG88_19755 [Lelliottia nimipressuralis]TYT29269.1 hypothetical protein FZO59_21035 [Lelliottia nimipressuralis]
MNFLINDGVIYRDDDGAIWRMDAPQNVTTLPTTAARILTYLLQNANSNQVISRDEIFEHIWSQHGLQASNNTLNQYISLIRKTLLEMQCEEEIIKTVPRLGFLITASVKVSSSQSPSQDNEYNISVENTDNNRTKTRISLKTKIAIFILFLSALFMVNTLYEALIQSRYNIAKASIEELGNLHGCPIYTFFKSSPTQLKLKVDRVAKIADRYNLNCVNNSIYYFHIENMFVESPRYFLARCTLVNGELKNISGCITVYDGGYANEK